MTNAGLTGMGMVSQTNENEAPAADADVASDRVVILGKIGSPFGVQGWVKVTSFTDPAENILDYEHWQLGREGQWRDVEVEEVRVTGKGVLAKLAGVESPEAARMQTGQEIGVWRSELPPPEDGGYYWADLEGLLAVSDTGAELGRIDHFRSTPGGTLVVIHGAKEHWVPFVKERIVEVNVAQGRVVLDWQPDWI